MMEAEMYGMIPRAKRLERFRAPPENMLNMSRIEPWFCSNRMARASGLTPGTGMKVPMRYTSSAPTRKSSRWRSSVSCPMPLSAPTMEVLPWAISLMQDAR